MADLACFVIDQGRECWAEPPTEGMPHSPSCHAITEHDEVLSTFSTQSSLNQIKFGFSDKNC